MVPVNVTEARYLHEMDHLIHGKVDEKSQKLLMNSNPSSGAVKQMEGVPPLYEKVEPLMKKITSGLGGMGKIVGSQTKCKDIQPDILAVAISVKERCDKEVVLPMLELKETVNARREALVKMREDQMQQIASLKHTVNTLQENIAAIEAKAETAQENSQGLAKRSTAVLQASQDLLPSLTQAEYNYFQQLKRLKANLENMQKGFSKIDKSLSTLRDNMEKGRLQCAVTLEQHQAENIDKILDGEETVLASVESHMQANEERARRMMGDAGLVVAGPPESLLEEGQ
jgi:phage shock protein A